MIPQYDVMMSAFEDEMKKIAESKIKSKVVKNLGIMALGAGGYEMARSANEDRRTGRAVRLQQQGF